jgi:CubicO group peptidase (beta-lactamase class C family)
MPISASNELERATPESQGIASSSILQFVEAVESKIQEFHSFILVRHGYVVAEGWWLPYAKEHPHMMFSLSKSFTSTAVGLAVAEGYFSLDDLLISQFPDDLPETVSENLAKVRIRHLMSMSTGQEVDTMSFMFERPDLNWVKGFFTAPFLREAGTHFVYNTGATYMLSALIQKKTGQTLIEFLTPRLFEPLGIENPTWESCPLGINTGGFGLSIKTDDIAKFGQLYLQKGLWADKRLLSEDWVNEATSFQVSNGDYEENDWRQGYGFQFWRCRHNAYRGDGAFGQYCIVMPEQDAVLAITAGLPDMQIPLNLVWDILLPAMQETSLPEDSQAQQALSEKLQSLAFAPIEGNATSPSAANVSGKSYHFESNELEIETLSIEFAATEAQLSIKTTKYDECLRIGYSAWIAGETALFNPVPPFITQKFVASGAWASDTLFKILFRLYETPFLMSVNLSFEGEELVLESKVNVSFMPPTTIRLVGKP